jgi:hypothetical protein
MMPLMLIGLYGLIVALSVGISGYLSYGGLVTTAGEITFFLVLFLMLIIFSMDMAISYYRAAGKRVWIFALFIWSIAAFFSIASNFNFLYTNFMRDDVAATTVAAQLQVFRDDLVETRQTLLAQAAYQQALTAQKNLSVELDNLREQISDPLRPGCGEECRIHLAKVQEILGSSITNLAIPPLGSREEVVDDWYARYRGAAENMLDTLLASTQYSEITILTRKIDDALLDFSDSERVIGQKGGLAALSQMSSLSDDVMRQANAILADGGDVQHTSIDPSLGRLGEIAYSFQNGFVEMPNRTATVLSLIMASIVDVLPLLIAFALFGKGRLERPEKDKADRGSGGRRVIS